MAFVGAMRSSEDASANGNLGRDFAKKARFDDLTERSALIVAFLLLIGGDFSE